MNSIKNIISICFLVLVLMGCETDNNCEGLICETGPVSLQFVVVDKITGENLFATGRYEDRDINIVNSNGESAQFYLSTENDLYQIRVLLGMRPKSDVYTIQIGNDIEFELSFILAESTSECCTSTGLEEWNIEGIEFEIEQNTGTIKILMETE